ncbi:MAG: type II toxin-antitoxin system VapB family antitoxin [Pseudonocardiaceae bacterium]
MAFPVRGLPADVVEKLDIAAVAKGMSRNAYVAEVLTQHVRRIRPTVTRESFARAAELAADLGDETLLRAAWT